MHRLRSTLLASAGRELDYDFDSPGTNVPSDVAELYDRRPFGVEDYHGRADSDISGMTELSSNLCREILE